MDYLAREGAPIAPALWEKIDAAVIDNAKKHMVARRFLSLYGPLGPGASVVAVDSAAKDEALENGVGRITGRRLVELPQLYEDFSLLWRDLEEAQRMGYPVDLSAPAAAAQRAAKREDELGRYALVLSPEVYLNLQRLVPNVGLLELDRIAKLVDGRVYPAGPYGAGKAVLVCAEPQYMDLAVGADLAVGYLEQKDLNHYFRILETVALRLKEPKAVVVFE